MLESKHRRGGPTALTTALVAELRIIVQLSHVGHWHIAGVLCNSEFSVYVFTMAYDNYQNNRVFFDLVDNPVVANSNA
jgi:hypothetical protein